MKKRIILIAGFSILMLLASSLTAEARGRFNFGFSFGFGGRYYEPYGYTAYYPAPGVSYYHAPYRPYHVYRTYGPAYRHEGRNYSLRGYYRR